MITDKVRELLAEAALRSVVGPSYDGHADYWRGEIKDELMQLDTRPLHVPSGNAHDSTCVAACLLKDMIAVF